MCVNDGQNLLVARRGRVARALDPLRVARAGREDARNLLLLENLHPHGEAILCAHSRVRTRHANSTTRPQLQTRMPSLAASDSELTMSALSRFTPRA
jgi:hypothetical protein